MISLTSKHALNVLRALARDPEARVATGALARVTGVPANYLSKILDQLRKHGVVEGEKGWGGGFRLRPEALKLPIREIAAIFDGRDRGGREECIFGLAPCNAENPCALHPYWERICSVLDEMLTSNTVRDLLKARTDPLLR